jgi:hypothetical protein
MRSDDTDVGARNWESVVLDRIRGRIEHTDPDGSTDVGWESAALERLRAHFEAEE